MAINASNPKFQKALLIVLGVIGGGYLYWMYVFRPQLEEVTKVEGELMTVQSNLATARAVVQAADTLLLTDELAKRLHDLALAEELLPAKENLPALLSEISSLGQTNGIDFTLFEPKTPIQHEMYQERPYALTIHGGFHQTARFLSDVASLPQVIKPTALSLVRDVSEGAGQGETLTAKLTLTTYLLIPGQPAPPPAAKKGKK
ncbi:MAG: type 4a pilus biogenesis protein PilO [Candidatus Glassbacteria bacterium]